MKLERVSEIQLAHQLVNSISIVDDSIYYTSGLNNSVIKYDMTDGVEENVIGGVCGYGKYKFREPVHAKAFVQNNDLIVMVCDWHNHRVVKYVNQTYVTEIGIHSSSPSSLKNVAKFIKGLSIPGSYIHSHFTDSNTSHSVVTNFTSNALYFLSSTVRLLAKRFYRINKPNGLASFRDGVIFTQKNSNSLTYLDTHLNFKEQFTVPKSGRLGNVNRYGDKVIFCVESTGLIYTLDSQGSFEAINLAPMELSFKPFAAIMLNDDLLAVTSMAHVHVFDIRSGAEKARHTVDGELHGIELYNNDVFVCDRLHAKIYRLRLNHD